MTRDPSLYRAPSRFLQLYLPQNQKQHPSNIPSIFTALTGHPETITTCLSPPPKKLKRSSKKKHRTTRPLNLKTHHRKSQNLPSTHQPHLRFLIPAPVFLTPSLPQLPQKQHHHPHPHRTPKHPHPPPPSVKSTGIAARRVPPARYHRTHRFRIRWVGFLISPPTLFLRE